ncbi:hypothetical protein LJC23_07200 [Desulfovibrio sp. OttesenSCG-928-I05]|nr:hypothetical protein [Desulfovibrio sp. OttesenSCG-928-I05]
MPTFYSPTGNPEVWEEKPEGYFTEEEWEADHPAPEPEPPTLAQLQKQFTDAIQNHLDSFAKTGNYDNILSAASYATSTNSKFHREGQYAVEIRDAVWAKGYAILDEVLSGQRPLPSIEEVLAELPEMKWPTEVPDA